MNTQEAAALLAVAAAFDNRKPDADAATAWGIALSDVSFVDARNAVVAHYRASNDWLMPAMVRNEVKRIRRDRILNHGPIEPPADMDPDDREAYSLWLTEAHRAIADGQTVPTTAAVQSGTPMPKELEAQMAGFGRLPADVETEADQ